MSYLFTFSISFPEGTTFADWAEGCAEEVSGASDCPKAAGTENGTSAAVRMHAIRRALKAHSRGRRAKRLEGNRMAHRRRRASYNGLGLNKTRKCGFGLG